MALDRQGRTDEAIAQYRQALAIDPTFVDSYCNLGSDLARQGRVDEAITEYRAALRINPASADAHYNLGNALLQEGHADEAIAEYRAALLASPADAEAGNNLGNALLSRGQTGEAIAVMQKALEVQPASVTVENNLAWMLATAPEPSLRDGARAVQLARQASQSSGGANPVILHTLAAAYAQAGDFSEAIKTAESALQLAGTQGNAALAAALQREVQLYKDGQPFRPAP